MTKKHKNWVCCSCGCKLGELHSKGCELERSKDKRVVMEDIDLSTTLVDLID